MKRVLLVLFFAIAAVAVTYAQKDTTTHAKKTLKAAKTHTADTAHKKVSAIKQVGLTADQQAKLKANSKEFNDKKKQVKADASLTEAQKKAKIKELNKEKKKGADTVLTAEQKAKLKEIKKQEKANAPKKNKPTPKTTR